MPLMVDEWRNQPDMEKEPVPKFKGRRSPEREAMEVLPSNSKALDPIAEAPPALQDDQEVSERVRWWAY